MEPATAHALARGYVFGRMDAGDDFTHDTAVLFADAYTQRWVNYHQGTVSTVPAVQEALTEYMTLHGHVPGAWQRSIQRQKLPYRVRYWRAGEVSQTLDHADNDSAETHAASLRAQGYTATVREFPLYK